MKRFILLLATTVTFISAGVEDKNIFNISCLFEEPDSTTQNYFDQLDQTSRKLYMQKYTEILIARRTFTSSFLLAGICAFALEGKTEEQKRIIKAAIDEANDTDKRTNRFVNKLNIEAHTLRGGRNTPTVQLNFDIRKNIEHQAARKMMLYMQQARQYAQSMWQSSGRQLDAELIDQPVTK